MMAILFSIGVKAQNCTTPSQTINVSSRNSTTNTIEQNLAEYYSMYLQMINATGRLDTASLTQSQREQLESWVYDSYKSTGPVVQLSQAMLHVMLDDLDGENERLSTTSYVENDYQITPNPVGKFLVINSKTRQLVSIIIFDLQGRIIFENKIAETNSPIPIALEGGIYFISIDDGIKKEYKKFIVTNKN